MTTEHDSGEAKKAETVTAKGVGDYFKAAAQRFRSAYRKLRTNVGKTEKRVRRQMERSSQDAQKGLRAGMDYFFRYLVVIALFVLAIWIVLKVTLYLTSIIAPAHEIVFVPYDASDTKAKEATQFLSAKLRRLQSYALQTPSGYGFLELPALTSIPHEAQEQASKDLETLKDINIKIKDVDVSGLVRAIQGILSPPRYEFRVRIIDLPDATEVSCDLVYEDKHEANWHSQARKAPANASASTVENQGRANIVDALLDDVLFQMIYDFMTKPEFAGWGLKTEGDFRPRNWQTLQAYTRGVQALTAYQQNLDHRDLEDALKALKRLPVVAPDNPYGLYYYGIALSEDRQEAQAVAVFEQLQRLLTEAATAPPTVPKPKPGFEKMFYEASFNEATARLKLYRQDAGDQAVRTLGTLIEELKEKKDKAAQDKNDADKCYYAKLLATTYAQLAYTHGTILSFIYFDKYSGKPVNPIPPEISGRWNDVTTNLNLAKAEIAQCPTNCWNADRPDERAQREREKNDIAFRISNAEGYSTFRWAEYEVDEAKFKGLCEVAIRNLEQANLARPNHYEVLQNMAMIYEDERYNPDGRYLDRAESLYLLTKDFVPNDYYQFEHLAQIQWQRIKLAGSAESADLIKKGKEYASEAVRLRPQTTNALFLMARFNVKAWKNAKAKNTPDPQSAAEAISNFKQALTLVSNGQDIRSDYTDFLLLLADSGTKDPKTALESGSSLLQLAKEEFANKPDDRKRLLRGAILMLSKAQELSATKNTEELKKINEEAQKLHEEATQLLASS